MKVPAISIEHQPSRADYPYNTFLSEKQDFSTKRLLLIYDVKNEILTHELLFRQAKINDDTWNGITKFALFYQITESVVVGTLLYRMD